MKPHFSFEVVGAGTGVLAPVRSCEIVADVLVLMYSISNNFINIISKKIIEHKLGRTSSRIILSDKRKPPIFVLDLSK